MAQKRLIAKKRIIGIHPVSGREVLIAAAGRPIPSWYDPKGGETQEAGAPAPVESGAVTSAKAGGTKRAAAKKKTSRRNA